MQNLTKMNSENDLIQKLMISKKIMEKHKEMPRNQNGSSVINMSSPELQDFEAPVAKYNLPQEFMTESKPVMTQPMTSSRDKILSSKLPDEIKKLMIEHPIAQPNQTQTSTLSNDIIEKATRLMNVDASGKVVNNYSSNMPKQQPIMSSSNLDSNSIKQIVRETIEEVLSENNLLIESVSKTNDLFSFKVGKHIFEGKVTKIKKLK